MPPKKGNTNNKAGGIKIGKIIFKPTITAEEKQCIKKLESKINLNGFRWELVNGLFTECNVASLLEVAQQININHLGLDNNQHPTIIQDLCLFNPYQKLANLILRDNLIESIEPILKLNAPLLWRVDFSDNLICNIKSAQRLHMPELVMFRVGNNKINQFNGLEKAYCPKLYELSLNQNRRFSNITPLFKIEGNQFRQIYSHTTGIIASKRIKKQLEKRFTKGLNFQL